MKHRPPHQEDQPAEQSADTTERRSHLHLVPTPERSKPWLLDEKEAEELKRLIREINERSRKAREKRLQDEEPKPPPRAA
jgi:hypothetical protein